MSNNFQIKPYSDPKNFCLIKKIQELINGGNSYIFYCVIIHGSLSTDENIPYSDFDGLLILKDKYCESKDLKKFINESTKIIYEFDPLQHHGWFIITERELLTYPQTYFPFELFEFSRLIYPGKEIELKIMLNDEYDYHEPFMHLSNSILDQIRKSPPQNIYTLKSFLSQVMLLPTIYLQSKLKKGIYKKHSFKIASADFSREDWQIIDNISEIRKNWQYSINKIQHWFLTQPNPIIRKIGKRIAPPIPQEFNEKLTDGFYNKILTLLNSMEKKLIENN